MSDNQENNEEEVFRDEMLLPDSVELLEDGVIHVFTGDDEVGKTVTSSPTTTEEILRILMNNENGYDNSLAKTLNSDKYETSKSFEHSNQSKTELGQNNLTFTNAFENRIVAPPYDPQCFAKFLDLSEVHERCVKVKVRDSVGRAYKIKSKYAIDTDKTESQKLQEKVISEEDFQKDREKITKFIDKCNSNEAFAEICYKVGMDKEAIGWGAFEVIREGSGKIARLQHLPATKLRVLKGFEGFVEELDGDMFAKGKRYTYYQPFGQKFGKWVPDPFDLSSRPKKVFRPYDPDEDGELEFGKNGLTFNLVDKDTGQPMKGKLQSNFKEAANEVLYIPNTHSSTIYYGHSDIVSAIGAIITNVHIRDYLLQFFEHNCIPRYAVIVRGAKVDDEFMKLITEYFENKVKGSAHKTIILALSGFGGRQVEIEFQALTQGNKEADFLNTRKANDAQITVAHGIPPAMLGINDAASLGSGKGLSQADMYKNRIMLPLQLYWASKMNKLFKLGLGCRYAKLEFDATDIRDAFSITQTIHLLLADGVITVNEARRQLGFDGSIAGGDISTLRSPPQNITRVQDIPKLKLEMNPSAKKSKDKQIKDKPGRNQDKNLDDSIVASQLD